MLKKKARNWVYTVILLVFSSMTIVAVLGVTNQGDTWGIPAGDEDGIKWTDRGDGIGCIEAYHKKIIATYVTKANARLIAASPDLLTACEAIIDASDEEYIALELCKNAINKAKGE